MREQQPSNHVLLIAEEQLFPTHHGGLLATRNEIEAMRAAGFDVTVVVPYIGEISPEQVTKHEAVLGNVLFVRQRGKLRATLTNPLLPYVSSRRLPGRTELKQLLRRLADVPKPVAVVAVHEYTLPLAQRILADTSVPLVLRSQNDEVVYLSGLARSARRLRRKALLHADVLRLRLAHRRMLRHVQLVALISPHDEPAFARLGAHTVLLPPTLSSGTRDPSRVPLFEDRSERLVFVGALDVPHTADGILWFAREVLPKIRAVRPETELEVIGRGADSRLIASLSGIAGVLVTGEVGALEPYFDAARVFVNPIFEGSGVNMKMGPPLAAGVPVVTTSFGLRGLDALAAVTPTADEPQDLAALCLQLLGDGDEWAKSSAAALEVMRAEYDMAAGAEGWRRVLELAQTE